MSGDVQPRKRKDKKKKKDELGVEEPRGTAAIFGEGDVFMHSHHEHGTGGHWCAKIIFFSLLAVLITLIGLIILENRGLTELEANSVESRYSGVLEGWLEDAPDDDHHDEHTLELKHHGNHDEEDINHQQIDDHDDDEDEHDGDHDDDGHDDDHDDDEHDGDHDDDENDGDEDDDENDSREDDEQENASEEEADPDTDDLDDQDSEENDVEHVNTNYGDDYVEDNDDGDGEEDENDDNEELDENEHTIYEHQDSIEDLNEQDEDNEEEYEKYEQSEDINNEVDENNDSLEDTQKEDSLENDDITHPRSLENGDDDDLYDEDYNGNKQFHSDEDEEEHEEEEEDSGIEVEKLEKEVTDEIEQLSIEEVLPEEDDKNEDVSAPEDDNDDEEFLEADDVDDNLPIVEQIVAPKGKPFIEVEEEPTTIKPIDTLADEEEYEKQQEELRREQEQASHMWLKLAVGGALLVATHAVVRRLTAPRDDEDSEEHAIREETPSTIDRRMTLIPSQENVIASPREIEQKIKPFEQKIVEKVSLAVKSVSIKEDELSEDEEPIDTKGNEEEKNAEVDKELYSDEDVDEEIDVDKEEETQENAKPDEAEEPEDDEVPDDVEIIDEEQLGEELEEEEEDEEEISDVDDAELLSRLEAKYGRLPEPERPGRKNKDGGNSLDDWPGEPSDKYWRQQLDQAEDELGRGDWKSASHRLSSNKLSGSGRAKWLSARAIDISAEQQRDNQLLTRAINAYLEVLKMHERLNDEKLLQVSNRILDRIKFRGNYLSAEPVYRLLIRRFPDVVDYRNNLTVSFLMGNRADLAEEVIKETLKKWPKDRIALAHLGFVLKTEHNKLEEAVDAFEKALEGDTGPATEPRFYYHLGDSLLLLGRFAEAHEVHKRGAAHGHFLSPAQRSLYNVNRLKSQPWWDVNKTPYANLARALEKSWKEILKEAEAAQALYEMEKEGLKERGEWSQLDIFVQGMEVPDRCGRAPVTCSIIRSEVAASRCRRGQVKFSAMKAGTHVRPHVGPTNCRLRMHLALSNTKDTYIRVDQEIRQWQVGKVLMFDDSFEHEVWHNGTGTRLVLIVDVWHPALTPHERRTLAPI